MARIVQRAGDVPKKSLWQRIKDVALTDVGVIARGGVKEGSLELLEELLLEADFGVTTSMRLIADVERQYEWYGLKANWEVAERYLAAVQATCKLLGQHPLLGPRGGLNHPRLRDWHFFVVLHSFNKHVLFYEVHGHEVTMR